MMDWQHVCARSLKPAWEFSTPLVTHHRNPGDVYSKRGSLTRGKHANSFLIPSGERDTPSAREWWNPFSKTEMEWGAGGKLQNALPSPPLWPGNPEISNPQLFLHESLWDRSSQKALCWHFNSLPCSRGRELSTPSLPHPCQAAERGTPTPPSSSGLPTAGPALSSPTRAQELPKGPRKDVSGLGAPSRQVMLLLLFSCLVMSNSLWPHGLQHARLPVLHHLLELAQTRPLSWWCHPTISSSVIPFSSCLQSFPASGAFLMSQLFAPGGQSIRAPTSTSVLPKNIQGWFPLGLTGDTTVLFFFFYFS